MRLRDGITADLAFLDEYADRIVELNLARSDVGDEIVARLARLVNLEVLHLEQRGDGRRPDGLRGFDEAAAASTLVDTAVGDEGIAKARVIGLRRLYLWQSRATRAGADALEAEIPTERPTSARWLTAPGRGG
ncbi:MAG: hypothetical protein R3F20_14545 [Planctomycetota bacterium]